MTSIDTNQTRLQNALHLQEQTQTKAVPEGLVTGNKVDPQALNDATENSISETARALQALFTKISELPVVDEARVAAAKEKVANGTLQLMSNDPATVLQQANSIASEIMSFEGIISQEK